MMANSESKKTLMTYTGLKSLEDELENLKVVRRKEIAAKIKEAREQGDLSENAEYDAAKDEQRDIEARIEEIEKLLKHAEVVVEEEVDLKKINLGCTVVVHDMEYDEDLTFKIAVHRKPTALRGESRTSLLSEGHLWAPRSERRSRWIHRPVRLNIR